MTKKEMIKALSEKLGVSQIKTGEILNGLESFIGDVVEAQEEIIICGIKIATKEVEAKSGRLENKYGVYEYETPAKIVPTIKFVPSAKDKLTKEK